MRFVCVDGGREGKRGSWDSGFPKIRKVMPQINSLSGNSSSIPKATTAADDGGRRSYLLYLSIYHLPTIHLPPPSSSIKSQIHKSQIHKFTNHNTFHYSPAEPRGGGQDMARYRMDRRNVRLAYPLCYLRKGGMEERCIAEYRMGWELYI